MDVLQICCSVEVQSELEEHPVMASLRQAVFVEFGKGGSSAAGPIARQMLEAYFGLNKPAVAQSAQPAKRSVAEEQELLTEGPSHATL